MKRNITVGLALAIAGICGATAQTTQPVTPADKVKATSTPTASPAPAAAPDFFSQAPAGVEDALRARLKTFYDCYLTGTFRQAYELVAPDSKDAYFDAMKSTYHTYKISRIDFTENYTRARVMLIVNTDFKFQGHSMRLDAPIVSTWKVVDGQWYWWVVPRAPGEAVKTPFGEVYPSDKTSKNGAAGAGQGRPDEKTMMAVSSAMPLLVKPVLTLSAANHYEDKTQLVNRSRQKLKFQVESEPLDGLVIDPSALEIPPGKTVTIKAQFTAKKPPAGPKQMHLAYISVSGGFRMQFYVAIEPADAPAEE